MKYLTVDQCFRAPIIPVVWDPGIDVAVLSRASSIILQGGPIAQLPKIVEKFQSSPLDAAALFVHIDLVSGLENNEQGLEYLSSMPRINGVVSIHHHLAKPARQLGLMSIVRLFLSDTRALERGLSVVAKSKPDVLEILPGIAAVKVAKDFAACPVPRIAGGLCRTPDDVKEVLNCGCRAVTSSSPTIWKLNP